MKKVDNIIINNKSEFTVVHAENASKAEIFAATELQEYIFKCSKVRIPVMSEADFKSGKAIYIGKTKKFAGENFNIDFSKFNDDGFIIKTARGNLFLAGACDKATIYAVYDYLEKAAGIKFIAEDYTHIPAIDALALYDYDIVEIPSFAMRAYLANGAQRQYELNVVHMRMGHEYTKISEEHGGNILWSDAVRDSHNTFEYVPPDVYLTPENKEQNKHMYFFENDKPVDLCFSDGITDDGKLDTSIKISAASAAIESLKKFVLSSKPDCKYYMLGQMDGKAYCTCPKCVKNESLYKRSGILIRFANVVAEHVQKWADENLNGRKINIVIFAYQYTEMAPVFLDEKTNSFKLLDKTVMPADNIYIRLAPIEASFYYPLTHEKQIPKYNRWFKEWQAVGKHFMLWTYHTMFAFSFFWYYPTLQAWSRNFEDYKKMGVEYLFLQSDHCEYHNWKAIMETYIASKMLWNHKLNPYDLVKEFNHYYYGIAARFADEFFEKIDNHHNALAKDDSVGLVFNIYDGPLWEIKNQPYEFLTGLLDILNKADDCVKTSNLTEEEKTTLLRRISRIKLTPLYMIMYNYTNYFEGDEEGKIKVAKQFFDICDNLGVIYYAEGPMIKDIREKYLTKAESASVKV